MDLTVAKIAIDGVSEALELLLSTVSSEDTRGCPIPFSPLGLSPFGSSCNLVIL